MSHPTPNLRHVSDPSLFDIAERDPLLRTLDAVIAPVAASTNALIDNLDPIEIADAVYDAFGLLDSVGGLTRAQIWSQCTSRCPDEHAFDLRFAHFVRMGMLLPAFRKKFEQRYVFNPASAAGIMVLQRLAERGGVDELVSLLDRTRRALQSRTATEPEVRKALRDARQQLTVAADYLFMHVANSPLDALLAERRQHQHRDLFEYVSDLNALVTELFPQFDELAHQVVIAAQRYIDAREQFMGRLLEHGARARDFRLLAPEDYLAAAYTGTVESLSDVASGLVFDPGVLTVDPDDIVQAVLEYRGPDLTPRVRPPRPEPVHDQSDPFEESRAKSQALRWRHAAAAELALDGSDKLELTNRMRATGWAGTAAQLAGLFAAHADESLPYELEMSDAMLVDPHGPVTYMTPVTVRRVEVAAAPPLLLDVARLAQHVDDDLHRVQRLFTAAVPPVEDRTA